MAAGLKIANKLFAKLETDTRVGKEPHPYAVTTALVVILDENPDLWKELKAYVELGKEGR